MPGLRSPDHGIARRRPVAADGGRGPHRRTAPGTLRSGPDRRCIRTGHRPVAVVPRAPDSRPCRATAAASRVRAGGAVVAGCPLSPGGRHRLRRRDLEPARAHRPHAGAPRVHRVAGRGRGRTDPQGPARSRRDVLDRGFRDAHRRPARRPVRGPGRPRRARLARHRRTRRWGPARDRDRRRRVGATTAGGPAVRRRGGRRRGRPCRLLEQRVARREPCCGGHGCRPRPGSTVRAAAPAGPRRGVRHGRAGTRILAGPADGGLGADARDRRAR